MEPVRQVLKLRLPCSQSTHVTGPLWPEMLRDVVRVPSEPSCICVCVCAAYSIHDFSTSIN